jgi:hypothetical protein
MNNLIPILILLGGAALGALITWLIVSARAKRAFTDGKAESATQIATLNERFAAKEHSIWRTRPWKNFRRRPKAISIKDNKPSIRWSSR